MLTEIDTEREPDEEEKRLLGSKWLKPETGMRVQLAAKVTARIDAPIMLKSSVLRGTSVEYFS